MGSATRGQGDSPGTGHRGEGLEDCVIRLSPRALDKLPKHSQMTKGLRWCSVSFGNAVETISDAGEDGDQFVAVPGNEFTSEPFLSGSPSDGTEEITTSK